MRSASPRWPREPMRLEAVQEPSTLARPVARHSAVQPASPPPKGPPSWQQMEQALHSGGPHGSLQVGLGVSLGCVGVSLFFSSRGVRPALPCLWVHSKPWAGPGRGCCGCSRRGPCRRSAGGGALLAADGAGSVLWQLPREPVDADTVSRSHRDERWGCEGADGGHRARASLLDLLHAGNGLPALSSACLGWSRALAWPWQPEW